MSDYIKREDALELISKCISYTLPEAKVIDFRHGEMNGLNWAGDIIEAIPSADVEPVRHGHWIEKAFRIMCSDCGAEFKDEILYMIGNDEQMSYCPNCGARMDGEDDE